MNQGSNPINIKEQSKTTHNNRNWNANYKHGRWETHGIEKTNQQRLQQKIDQFKEESEQSLEEKITVAVEELKTELTKKIETSSDNMNQRMTEIQE